MHTSPHSSHLPDRTAGFAAVMPAPFGALGIRISDSAIDEIVFLPPGTTLRAADTALAQRAVDQLTAWLQDPRHPFDLPLAARGTAFQQRVWRAIAAIPLGTVATYGELAHRLASAARAVGQACGANPFPLIIPCHRVVSSAGLGGFANARGGFLLDTKRWLLAHEARS